jgi:hypothetical protein
VAHEDGYVPDDEHASFVGVALEAEPLAEKEELREYVVIDLVGQFFAGIL